MKFNQFNLDARLHEGIKRAGFSEATPIQEQAIPAALSGQDLIATAQTGYDAGVVTQQFKPDIVVLDYMLPDVNGNVVCRTIRENPELTHIKILIISGMVNPAEVDKLMDAGADEFIKKPFNIEHVIERMLELAGT